MKSCFVALIVIGVSLHSNAAAARKSSNLRSDRIQISYVSPKNPDHETVFRLLKERQVLEKLKQFLSPLRLPRTLLLKFEGCEGVSNAWYADDAITVCYEYIADILRNAPQETTPAGVTRVDAIVGPTLEVFLHEAGHAVFDYLEVPILGREEDAADQFAAYLLLQFSKDDARRLIVGVAYSYHVDASEPSKKRIHLPMSTVFPRNASTMSCARRTEQIQSYSPIWWRKNTSPRKGPRAVRTSTNRLRGR